MAVALPGARHVQGGDPSRSRHPGRFDRRGTHSSGAGPGVSHPRHVQPATQHPTGLGVGTVEHGPVHCGRQREPAGRCRQRQGSSGAGERGCRRHRAPRGSDRGREGRPVARPSRHPHPQRRTSCGRRDNRRSARHAERVVGRQLAVQPGHRLAVRCARPARAGRDRRVQLVEEVVRQAGRGQRL